MKKTLAIALSLAALTVAPTTSARADDDGLRDAARQTVRLPLRAAGVATGLAVGVPMAITRRASNRMIEYTQSFADKIGGHTSAPPVIFASIVGLPFGLLVGTAEGEPFSQDMLLKLLGLANGGIKTLVAMQKEALK